jgi:arsenite/tail-anchored protein-transporting ATPase
VLVVSTDPAHSLGDALDVRLSSRHVAVRAGARRTLNAVELDAPRAFSRWLGHHRQALGDALEHGTWLDQADVTALLELPIPGIDELVAMLEIVRMSAAGQYDRVVVDTAPTGHTLRLLAAPETVSTVSAVLDALQREHRVIRQQFARVGRRDAADRLIELLARQARDTGALLRDPERTAFHWVMLPEDLSLAESRDALAALDAARIPVARIIVNRVIEDGPACPVCDRRRAAARRVLARVARGIGRGRVVKVLPDEPSEPRGIEALARIDRAAQSARNCVTTAGPQRSTRTKSRFADLPRTTAFSAAPPTPSSSSSARTLAAPSLLPLIASARLVFFGGKGGVGKTTTAAAAALTLARRQTGARVLLLSTDPAHSLGDVLRAPVDDRARAIGGAPSNLHVRELDAASALTRQRVDLEAALHEIAAALGAGAAGGRGGSELMDLAPPGIAELFGILSVLEAQDQYQRIIVDTAPTGHALRLLEMPAAARLWLQVLLRVLLKYRDLVRPGQLASELVELSKSVRQLQELLRDPASTQFLVVTRAAEVPQRETERLLARLRTLHLATPAVIVNARTLAPGRCPRCRAADAAERRQMSPLVLACRRRTGGCVIIQTPLAAPPPRGVAALDRWARTWM